MDLMDTTGVGRLTRAAGFAEASEMPVPGL
jgi:hypothetical protein